MSPFRLFNTIAHSPLLRWLLVGAILAGLLFISARAWSAAADQPVPISEERQHNGDTPPAYTISTLPQTLTISQGGGGSVTISVDHLSTASHPRKLTLTAAGMPSGVSASCSPLDPTGHSTLLLTAEKTASTGTVMLTISAAATDQQASAGTIPPTTLALTVISSSAPDFTPMIAPGKLSIPVGSDGTCQVSISPLNNFASPVTLRAVELPAGVTAAFEPASTNTSSLLHVSASRAANIDSVPVTIVAESGGITHTAHVLISVNRGPNFTVVPWTNHVTLAPGSTVADTFKLDSVNGFTSGIGLSVFSLPTGVTAHFSPSWAKTGSSTLILTADATAKPGQSKLTILAASGSLVHTSDVTIDIPEPEGPSFALSAWPQQLDIRPGGRAANTVSVVRNRGFQDTVALSASGLPDGITAEFAPPSTRGTSTLTLIAKPGISYAAPISVQITGVSGGVEHSTTLTVNVLNRSSLAPSTWVSRTARTARS